jgi:hypothetical protein
MRSRTLSALLATLLALAVVSLAADEKAASPTGAEPESSATGVIGEIPIDLRGVWLVAASGQIGTAARSLRNFPELWLVERDKEGELDFQMLHRELPPGVKRSVDEAAGKTRRWEPSSEDLAELDRSLEQLKPADQNTFLKHEIKVLSPEHYGDIPTQEPADLLEHSQFALQIKHIYRPQPVSGGRNAQLMSDDTVYAVQKATPTRLEGVNARLFLAAGFVPIPIRLAGPFTMYRVRAPGAFSTHPGLGARIATALGNLFRGCR